MADNTCSEACNDAYQEAVKKCYSTYLSALVTAQTPGEKQQARERFNNCMQLSKEAKEACLQECNS